MFTKEMLYQAHRLSEDNRYQLAYNLDQLCGCYNCCHIFNGLDELSGCSFASTPSVLCPVCQVDSLIVEDFKLPITPEFLTAMNEEFFPEVKQSAAIDPADFLSCFDALTRRDQKGIMNAVARKGCLLCTSRKQCHHATGRNAESDFVCDFAVDVEFFAKALGLGIQEATMS